VALGLDRLAHLAIEGLYGICIRYESPQMLPRSTTDSLQLLSASGSVSTVRPSGPQGIRERTRLGRPFLYVALRARVSTWPPLRLARLRFERESVGVVRPPSSHVIARVRR